MEEGHLVQEECHVIGEDTHEGDTSTRRRRRVSGRGRVYIIEEEDKEK